MILLTPCRVHASINPILKDHGRLATWNYGLRADFLVWLLSFACIFVATWMSLKWAGAYFSCQQLQHDIRIQLQLETGFKEYVKATAATRSTLSLWSYRNCPPVLRPLQPSFRFVRNICQKSPAGRDLCTSSHGSSKRHVSCSMNKWKE